MFVLSVHVLHHWFMFALSVYVCIVSSCSASLVCVCDVTLCIVLSFLMFVLCVCCAVSLCFVVVVYALTC